MKFTGTYKELKKTLEQLNQQGEWIEVNENQKQFRHRSGGILNWYPSTGTINFQGSPETKDSLQNIVQTLLNADKEDVVAVTEELKTQESRQEATQNIPKFAHAHRDMLNNDYRNSEVVIGLVGALGTRLEIIKRIIKEKLDVYRYSVEEIKISRDIIRELTEKDLPDNSDQYRRISEYMTAGNELRKATQDNAVMALGAIAKISQTRQQEEGVTKPAQRRAVLIDSIKHPEEVHRLRNIYSNGFYLVSVYADEKRRFDHLTNKVRVTGEQASELMSRDADESIKYGQHTRDAFHLADFFVHLDSDSDKFEHSIWRILELMFGKPFVTPTFDEFAMFMAFSSSLRSADLSRQVGAVIARNHNIVATGANDIPKAGGGLYWPEYNAETHQIDDKPDGRDYKRGEDSNTAEKRKIIEDILSKAEDSFKEPLREYLEQSRIKDITEYGRVVHAEMEAILSCARSNVSTLGAQLYCTTYPCHNCAKHIIAGGIKRVVYIEPYPKSKAMEFHSDAITIETNHSTKNDDMVRFEPFVGVGPRSFFNLFSMTLGSGYDLQRKGSGGKVVEWSEEESKLRVPLLPYSYLEREVYATNLLRQNLESISEEAE